MLFLNAKRKDYLRQKEKARDLIQERLAHFGPLCGVRWKRIAIRNTRRSWGSCSSLGNLNFSYKLLYLPACLRDYVIVHELCHLKHLNHSPLFWAEVSAVMPDYKFRKRELRNIERKYGTSITVLRLVATRHTCSHCIEEIKHVAEKDRLYLWA